MKRIAQTFHYIIYLNLIAGFLSALYMVFVVFNPEGFAGPLWENAKHIPQELFLRRRVYAIEAWIIFGFLSLYFALTTFRNPTK